MKTSIAVCFLPVPMCVTLRGAPGGIIFGGAQPKLAAIYISRTINYDILHHDVTVLHTYSLVRFVFSELTSTQRPSRLT
jgi:hypothetical protein